MSDFSRKGVATFLVVLSLTGVGVWLTGQGLRGSPQERLTNGSGQANKTGPRAPTQADSIQNQFAAQVRPFLERYCFSCHGAKKHKAGLDLSRDATIKAAGNHHDPWGLVLERLQAQEMPPEDAPRQPRSGERAAVIAWIQKLRDRVARQKAGDPGTVLARRLSNAELDYTIRDLTGVDIRPTREFPVDPANQAGFDNSGESLAMSPALLKKYLAAARGVADHLVLKPEGFDFAPYPVVTDTDRDRYCVGRIIDFYRRHRVDYADYFLAAWKYRHRAGLDHPKASLASVAKDARLSGRYLAIVWAALTRPDAEAGPMGAIRTMWRQLPAPDRAPTGGPRSDCERLCDLVLRLRRQLRTQVGRLHVRGISDGSQPLVLWQDRQLACRHRRYTGEVIKDLRKLAGQLRSAEGELAKWFPSNPAGPGSQKQLRAAQEQFCAVFPDAFVVADRGPYFEANGAGKGRPLTAGFHLMQGYFRDDGPLCDLILDKTQRRELDMLWQELNFVTGAPLRQYRDFIFFERAEPPRFMIDAEFDFARSEDRNATSPAKMSRLAKAYLAKARRQGAAKEALAAMEDYFTGIAAEIRQVERSRLGAEPSHLKALVKFTERAYRRPLAAAERDGVLAFYRTLRRQDGLDHAGAVHDTLVSVLLSPHFYYRVDLAAPGMAAQRLSDYELASRLSYFLWASMPDAELLSHAAAGDLHKPPVLKAQARRLLRDPRVRGLATEFAGNWLDFRRFEELNSVDRQRFPVFTNELRQAMFEEPIRYFIDVAGRNRSVLDLLYGNDTFVNGVLAKHYGMPVRPKSAEEWVRVDDARRYGRGGLLTMAAFLTKNAPGLRTSPVKRGYWVVRRLLGERIPPPPPTVPALPKDEAKLGELTLPQVLARHRSDKACAGCHRRFDAVGLAFEGFGPVGERRTRDLAGHPVQTVATFPDGKDRDGLPGLCAYLREKREGDFLDNLCGKLFSYALGRGLLLSDNQALAAMRRRLATDGYAFGSLVEEIITSPQFLHKRGRDAPRQP
jgi:hypothetical protein